MLKEMYCGKNAAVTEVEDFFENISLEWINSQKPQVKLSTKYNRPKDVAPMLEHVFNQWNETTK